VRETVLEVPAPGLLVTPDEPAGVGVLVVSGSSGRLEEDKARALAAAGAHALTIQYFGGPGQLPGICELPLETFVDALDRLAGEDVEQLGLVGLSKSAEAGLALATRDDRLTGLVATSPTSVTWANVGPDVEGELRPQRSCWTWQGEPLPFVPYDDTWQPPQAKPPYTFRGQYEHSLATYTDAVEAARILVERITARLALIAGGDDEVWPSPWFVDQIVSIRREHGLETAVVSVDAAGHSPVFPGTQPAPPSPHLRRGGTPDADRELGERAWPVILATLGLPPAR
jgi:hypothetical protein